MQPVGSSHAVHRRAGHQGSNAHIGFIRLGGFCVDMYNYAPILILFPENRLILLHDNP